MDGRQSILCNLLDCEHNDGEGECNKGCIQLDDTGKCEDAEIR